MSKPTYFDLPLIRSQDQQLKLDMGLDALRRINASRQWQDWMQIGEALKVVTEFAVAYVNKGPWHADNNRPAVRVFLQMWDAYQRSDGNNDKPLSSTERSQLRFIMDHPEIEVWRSTLDSTKQRSLNHPNVVVTSWRKSTQTPDKEHTQRKLVKQDVIVGLEVELAAKDRLLTQALRDREWAAPANLAKAEEALVRQLDGVGMAEKINSLKRAAEQLGITDVNKLLAKQPAPKRKRKDV